jgi:hypothetical protein
LQWFDKAKRIDRTKTSKKALELRYKGKRHGTTPKKIVREILEDIEKRCWSWKEIESEYCAKEESTDYRDY